MYLILLSRGSDMRSAILAFVVCSIAAPAAAQQPAMIVNVMWQSAPK